MSIRIHPTAIVEDGVTIGAGTAIWDNVHIRAPAVIGRECIIGEKSYIAYDVAIGDRVKINAYVYVCAAVTIETGVMIAAGTIFTNDRYPRATTADLTLLRPSEPDEHTLPTIVRAGATIGAKCVIGCDLEIGRFAMVGMGSVVTRSVPDFHLVAGHPARTIGVVCRCGQRLPDARAQDDDDAPSDLACPACNRPYRIEPGGVHELPYGVPGGPGATSGRPMTGEARRLNWGVVGGGFMGLTVAHRLADQGHKVTLIEAAPGIGGLAGAWRLGSVVWDRHYHVTLLSDLRLRNLLKELELEDELQWRTTGTGFYADGRLYPLNNAIDYLRLPALNLWDKLRLAATILYASRLETGRPLEDVPVSAWLTRLSGPRVFEKIWRPLLRAKLGENYKQTSAAFIWAVIRRLYAARRSGLKTEMFGYVPGGYARILAAFEEQLRSDGVELKLGCRVERIAHRGGRLQVETAAGPQLFDQVVVTLAAPLAARICIGLGADELERLRAIVYQGIICASVLLRRRLAGHYVTYITDDDAPFTAVIEMSALVDSDELDGHGLVYLPRYVTQDDPYWQLPDAEIEARFLDALLRMYPSLERSDIACFRISRVPHVLAISTLGYSDRLPPMTTTLRGLHIVNSAHIVNGTLNVNETVALAEDAVSNLLKAAALTGGSVPDSRVDKVA
jgi:protoporphyrinogen oxidase/acetyltransferase-like isoleucine patch superfamily enzyme